jgi:hypothetical protein
MKMKMRSKALLGLGVMLLVCVTVAFAAVVVKGSIINALTGFQYNGAAPSNHTLCGNGTAYVDAAACGPVMPARTCNSNGCYIQFPDGTLQQWGYLPTCAGTNCTITFPTAFTTTTNLSVTATVHAAQSNLTTVIDTFNTTSFDVETGGVVFVGGSGGSYSGGGAYSWIAIGN